MLRQILAVVGGLVVSVVVGGLLGAVRLALYPSYEVTSVSILVGLVHGGITLLSAGFVIGFLSMRRHVVVSVLVFISLVLIWLIVVLMAFPDISAEISGKPGRFIEVGVSFIAGLSFLAIGAWLGVRVRSKMTQRKVTDNAEPQGKTIESSGGEH